MRLIAIIIIGILLLDLFCSSEGWWTSRRRRSRRPSPRPKPRPRCHPPSTTTVNWFNRWDKPFTFTCPSGQAMTGIRSIYSSCHRDRVFQFACTRNIAVAKGRCHWSPFVNIFDQPVAFKCPLSGFITGIGSYHSNPHEDRRFKFRCCNLDHRFHRFHCTLGSHFLNHWKRAFNFMALKRHFLVGVISFHDNGQHDRLWKFETCKVRRYTKCRRPRTRKAKKN